MTLRARALSPVFPEQGPFHYASQARYGLLLLIQYIVRRGIKWTLPPTSYTKCLSLSCEIWGSALLCADDLFWLSYNFESSIDCSNASYIHALNLSGYLHINSLYFVKCLQIAKWKNMDKLFLSVCRNLSKINFAAEFMKPRL